VPDAVFCTRPVVVGVSRSQRQLTLNARKLAEPEPSISYGGPDSRDARGFGADKKIWVKNSYMVCWTYYATKPLNQPACGVERPGFNMVRFSIDRYPHYADTECCT